MLFQTRPQPRLTELTLSRRVESMPLLDISGSGPLADAFLVRGAVDFHDAVRFVRNLPWGRPTRPGDPLSVLEDGRGTAADKHILIAALARELGNEELQLILGVYRMTAESHPVVTDKLRSAGLESLPETFLWLRWYGGDFDFSSTRSGPRVLTLLQQEVVKPEQLPRYADLRHKDFLLRFLLSAKGTGLPDLDGLLALREECLTLVIEAEEHRRQSETKLAQEIGQAEEDARQDAVAAAERAAEAASRKEKELAEADRERKSAYAEQETKRRSRLMDRARARAAAAKEAGGTGDDTPAHRRRRTTRKAPGSGLGASPEVEEVEEAEEEAPRKRKSTRRAPSQRVAEAEGAPAAPRKRKSTRRAPGARAEVEEEAEAAAAPAPRKRKSTRRAPGARAAAPEAEEAAPKAKPKAAPKPKAEAAAKEVEEPQKAAPKRRKRTRKPPGKR